MMAYAFLFVFKFGIIILLKWGICLRIALAAGGLDGFFIIPNLVIGFGLR